jgi:hypothetical protein
MLSTRIQKVIPKVLYVTNLYFKFVLVKQLAQARGMFSIQGKIATLTNSNHQLIASCNLENDLYILGHSFSHNLKNKENFNIQPIREQAMSSTNSKLA